MLHLATRYGVRDHLMLLLITLIDGRTHSLITTANHKKQHLTKNLPGLQNGSKSTHEEGQLQEVRNILTLEGHS